ncbi:FAD-dependent oxidoreductase [Streptomyces sp. 184]|uniref:FAD-dependent oxidoreductase n=1 Tax=Streptomyces sp. 184 TaxID=1827526 RepID=UPI0038911DA3
MSRTYDVVVIGLGGMGSAAACHLAARGARVLGPERFGPARPTTAAPATAARASTAGATPRARSTVPLLLRARELWERLGRDAGEEVFTRTGGLMVGRAGNTMVEGSLASARAWDLPHCGWSAG